MKKFLALGAVVATLTVLGAANSAEADHRDRCDPGGYSSGIGYYPRSYGYYSYPRYRSLSLYYDGGHHHHHGHFGHGFYGRQHGYYGGHGYRHGGTSFHLHGRNFSFGIHR